MTATPPFILSLGDNLRTELYRQKVEFNQYVKIQYVFNLKVDYSFGYSDGLMEVSSQKRLKTESCNVCGSKACHEELRRDQFNEKFPELGSILEPGRPPKTDKATINGCCTSGDAVKK